MTEVTNQTSTADPALVVEPAADPAAAPAVPAVDPAPAGPPASALDGGDAPPVELPSIDPASYEFTFGEGFTPDDTLLSSFRETAAKLKLPPEEAQGLVALYESATRSQMEAQIAAHSAQREAWVQQINQFPEFQGERRTQSLQVLKTAMQEYGSPEAAKILNDSGLGDHPAIVRFVMNLAAALVEGSPVTGGAPPKTANGKPALASQFYPSMNS